MGSCRRSLSRPAARIRLGLREKPGQVGGTRARDRLDHAQRRVTVIQALTCASVTPSRLASSLAGTPDRCTILPITAPPVG